MKEDGARSRPSPAVERPSPSPAGRTFLARAASGRLASSTGAGAGAAAVHGARVHLVADGTPQPRGESAADLTSVDAAVQDVVSHDARLRRRFPDAGIGSGGAGCPPEDLRALSTGTDEMGRGRSTRRSARRRQDVPGEWAAGTLAQRR